MVLGKHGLKKKSVFLARKGVVIGTHLIEFPVHVFRRTSLGALEQHVFEEVAYAAHLRRFIAGAGADEIPRGDAQRGGIGLTHHSETVAQHRMLEPQIAASSSVTSSSRGPSVTIVNSPAGWSRRCCRIS